MARLSKKDLDDALAESLAQRADLYGQESALSLYAAGLYTGLAMSRYAPEKAEVWLRSFEEHTADVRGITPEQQEVDTREALRSRVEP